MDESKRTIDNWQDDKPFVEDKDAKQKQKARDIVESCYKAHPDWTANQIARETGVTPSTAAYHLCNIRKEQKDAEKPAEEKILVHEVTPNGGKYSFVSKEEAENMPNAVEVPKTECTEKAEAEPVNIIERIEKNLQMAEEVFGDRKAETVSRPKEKEKLSGDEMDMAMQNGILRATVTMLKEENDELKKVCEEAKAMKHDLDDERLIVRSRIEKLEKVIVEMCLDIYGGRR